MISLSKKIAALSLGLFAVAAPLHAQGPQFALGGGLGMPLGDFDDGADMGFHALGAVSFAPATMPVGFQLDANFSQFGTTTDDLNIRTLFATANAVYQFQVAEATRIRPYLIGGLGVYSNKATGDAAVGAESETDFGINAGAGFNFAAGAASLFVEGRFHNVFTKDDAVPTSFNQQFIPITVGVRFGGQ